MAGRLGTTEFWTAKVAAAMTEKDLLIVSADTAPVAEAEVAVAAEPAAETDPDESWWQEPEDETDPRRAGRSPLVSHGLADATRMRSR